MKMEPFESREKNDPWCLDTLVVSGQAQPLVPPPR